MPGPHGPGLRLGVPRLHVTDHGDELIERGLAGRRVPSQEPVDFLLVDAPKRAHLVFVSAAVAHRGTPCLSICFLSAARPRRWSALTAPGRLPSARATCSTVSSP